MKHLCTHRTMKLLDAELRDNSSSCYGYHETRIKIGNTLKIENIGPGEATPGKKWLNLPRIS